MGEFLVSLESPQRGRSRELALPNILHFEGVRYILRQLFPPYDTAPTFIIGLAGPTLRSRESRPNQAPGTVEYDERLTFAQCTDGDANEGGAYTSAMRSWLGYGRQSVTFTAGRESDGGIAESTQATFANLVPWARLGDWDNPDTDPDIEPPPYPWGDAAGNFEPDHGYPWQTPRVHPNYFDAIEPGGSLDWLADNWHRVGGFPITLAFLADASRSVLIASASFAAPLLWRPGSTVYVRYRGRVTN